MPPAVGPACHARALLAGGRGLLDLAPPDPDMHAVLRRAGVDATEERCRGLRALALATPGLDRVISGGLVGPSELRAVAARHALQVGIRMVGNVADGLDASITRHAADGATFACRQVLVGHGSRSAALRDAAAWVAACQRGGLVPLLDCTAPTRPRHGLAESEKAHTTAIADVVAELRRAGVDPAATLLGIGPVVPGSRSSQVDASEDVAIATVRSLREAGAGDVAGVVFVPGRCDRRLTAHLAAVQWLRPGWPVGFCLGTTLLAPVAAVWRGRPEPARAAQHELRGRFAATSAVLRAGLRELPERLQDMVQQ